MNNGPGWWGLDEAVRGERVGGWALGAALACPGGLGGACTEARRALREQRQPGQARPRGQRGDRQMLRAPHRPLEAKDTPQEKRPGIRVRPADQPWAVSLT